MVYFKVLIVTLLAAVATSEPPVSGSGYNYQQPSNSYNSPTNGYLPPTTGYSAPTNSYLPPTFSSGSQDYNHGHGHSYDNGHSHENEVPKSYEFGYTVKDAQSGNDYGRKESSDGNVVRGEYRVQLPDGRTQIVTYHADWKTGFHADVRYEGQAKYPEPTYNNKQEGYNYNAPNDFSGSLTGFDSNQDYKQPSTTYGPSGYH